MPARKSVQWVLQFRRPGETLWRQSDYAWNEQAHALQEYGARVKAGFVAILSKSTWEVVDTNDPETWEGP